MRKVQVHWIMRLTIQKGMDEEEETIQERAENSKSEHRDYFDIENVEEPKEYEGECFTAYRKMNNKIIKF